VDAALDLKLYIGGFTDTVGNASDNLKLSLTRAKSIAAYFRDKGIRGQIFYAGFGEKHLAVPTADSVDEARNRRAIYVITNTKPQGFVPPRGRWNPHP
jgi:outer membrane protein OmpA-like peptidoglycan-associated protein